jgi:hypothetical protein
LEPLEYKWADNTGKKCEYVPNRPCSCYDSMGHSHFCPELSLSVREGAKCSLCGWSECDCFKFSYDWTIKDQCLNRGGYEVKPFFWYCPGCGATVRERDKE